MADLIDQAQEFIEEMKNKELEKIRSRIPPFTGYCANPDCREPITKGSYCGKECRDEAQ